jgi:hypothetical protein
MDRRLVIAALACWPGALVLAQQEERRPTHRISAAELHKALSARFPVRLGLAGLLELDVSAPGLLLLPARNKLGASLLAEASGPALRRMQTGEMDLVFALRYEASDQTLRAHQLEVLDVRMPGLSADGLQALQRVLPAVAREAVGEIVMHRFTPRELALPDTMGFEPEKVTVVDDGVVIGFRPKQRR